MSTQYSFSDCLEKKIMFQVGCQPFWIKTTGNELPICTSISQYHKYFDKYAVFQDIDEIQLMDKSGCAKPCQYMEYKASIFQKKLAKKHRSPNIFKTFLNPYL